jgi:predicted GNAT family acetyltransferase
MSDTETDVVDEAANHRLLYREDGHDAQLVYEARDGQLVLMHTEVPDALGGRGIGGRLVQAAVERASKTGEVVLPWCPYARKWLEDHPDAASTVTVDWSDPAV